MIPSPSLGGSLYCTAVKVHQDIGAVQALHQDIGALQAVYQDIGALQAVQPDIGAVQCSTAGHWCNTFGY